MDASVDTQRLESITEGYVVSIPNNDFDVPIPLERLKKWVSPSREIDAVSYIKDILLKVRSNYDFSNGGLDKIAKDVNQMVRDEFVHEVSYHQCMLIKEYWKSLRMQGLWISKDNAAMLWCTISGHADNYRERFKQNTKKVIYSCLCL